MSKSEELRFVKREKSRWGHTPTNKRKDIIAWWLDSRDIGTGLRRGFANLQTSRNNDNFESGFRNILESFGKLNLNPYVLFYICAVYLGCDIPAVFPHLQNLKDLHTAKQRKRLAYLSAAASVLDSVVVPTLKRLSEVGQLNGYDSNIENIPAHLRSIERLCGQILNDKGTAKAVSKHGRQAHHPTELLMCICEYFQIITGSPRWELLGNIADLCGIPVTDIKSLQQSRNTLRNTHTAFKSTDKTNPLVQLDRALR